MLVFYVVVNLKVVGLAPGLLMEYLGSVVEILSGSDPVLEVGPEPSSAVGAPKRVGRKVVIVAETTTFKIGAGFYTRYVSLTPGEVCPEV
jgi:hypothetical protein